MSSSETGRLVLTSQVPGTLLSVLDSGLRPVASVRDYFDQQLPVGVYEIEGTLGDGRTSRLITIRPGADELQDITVQFSAAAPVRGLLTTNETHGELVTALSREVAMSIGPDSGLVFVLRNLRVGDVSPLRTDCVVLLDREMRQVSEWPSDWVADGSVAGLAGRLRSGPYVLRTYQDGEEGRTNATDQTIWLSEGWQTLVFIPNEPEGAAARGLSVQMARVDELWRPDEPTALAVEAALAGLRCGVPSVQPDLMRSLLSSKFSNPMLAILGMHALLLGPPPDKLFVKVLTNLLDLVGDHPDVLALAATRPDAAGYGPISVPWPPMLDHSYRRCLLPADLADENVLPQGSPAERVAPYIQIPGPWLQWSATDELMGRGVIPRQLSHSAATPAPTAATSQVGRLVNEMSKFQEKGWGEIIDQMGTPELARRAGLPETLVVSALRDLGEGTFGLG